MGTPNNDDPGASAGQSEREEKATTTLDLLLARLQALRIARGLTQEAFAEVAGFSYKYYQAVEAGRKRDLRLSTLERLARAHRLEVWQLLAPATPVRPRRAPGKPRR